MKKQVLLECIIALLVLLFVYAGSSKLMDWKSFKSTMRMQPFGRWVNDILATVLPFAELLIAIGLGFKTTRRFALYAYSILMLCFTGYTAMIVFGFFAHRPCGCGGIINHLGWTGHLVINLVFLTLSCVAIRLHNGNKLLYNQEVSRKPATE